jgi:hypothetical protein
MYYLIVLSSSESLQAHQCDEEGFPSPRHVKRHFQCRERRGKTLLVTPNTVNAAASNTLSMQPPATHFPPSLKTRDGGGVYFPPPLSPSSNRTTNAINADQHHSSATFLPPSKCKTEGECIFHHSPPSLNRTTNCINAHHHHSSAMSLPRSKCKMEGECIFHHHFPARNERQTAFTPTITTPLLETNDKWHLCPSPPLPCMAETPNTSICARFWGFSSF